MDFNQFLKAGFAATILRARFGNDVNWSAAKRLAIYPGLDLTYNRIKKAANTTVVMLLREMESHAAETRELARRNTLDLRTIPYSVIPALRRHCFFIVIRNPYTRVLSAFLQKFQYESYRQKFPPFELSSAGFATFVDWLGKGNLSRDAHWDLQTKAMFLPLEKYDAVVRFENFAAEMQALLECRHLKPPEGRLHGLYPSDVNKRTAADSRLNEFYDPAVARHVAELYRKDFETLGYSRTFPGSVDDSAAW